MNRLDDLIEQLCPSGVEYRKLEEVCKKIFAGGTPSTSNSLYYGGEIPWLRSGEINFNSISDTEIKITEQGCKNSSAKWVEPKSVLIAMTGATVARVGVNEIALTANQSVCALEVKEFIFYKYLYYFLASQYENIKKMSQGALTSLNLAKIKTIKVPIPPLKIQHEIVRILDCFTSYTEELINNLSKELTARKKQYEYYRDSLLDFSKDKNIKWVYLQEVGDVTKLAGFEFSEHINYSNEGSIIALRGLNVKNGHLDLTQVKYIDNSNFEKLKRSKLIKEDMLFTYVGTVGQVALVDENDKYYLAPNVARIRFLDRKINPRFMKYYFQSKKFIDKQVNRLMEASSMKNLTMEKIRKFQLPLPSLEQQNYIVSILDRFDSLCNDITQGLPFEIEARKKQYEYYRSKLLTFKCREGYYDGD